jgi:Glycosyltransferases involved in cell wall biogenesis
MTLLSSSTETRNDTNAALKSLSVVLPVYQSAGCLDLLYERLSAVLQATGLRYEIVFVEDCGPDDAWERLLNLASLDRNVRAFQHSKNFGQHAAIATGLSQCRGDTIIVMDADLQDPPEMISKFLDSALAGNEIVLSVRSRRNETRFRKVSSQIVRRGFPLYRRLPNGLQYGSFSLLSRRVVDRYMQERDRCNYFLKILDRFPVATGYVQYDQDARLEGNSSYSIKRLVRLFCTLVITDYLLKVLAVGTLVALAVSVDLFYTHFVPGWYQILLVVADVVALCAVAFALFCLLVQSKTRRKLAANAVTVGALSEGALSDHQFEMKFAAKPES